MRRSRDRLVVVQLVAVDADDDPLLRLDLGLVAERRLGDLALEEVLLDRRRSRRRSSRSARSSRTPPPRGGSSGPRRTRSRRAGRSCWRRRSRGRSPAGCAGDQRRLLGRQGERLVVASSCAGTACRRAPRPAPRAPCGRCSRAAAARSASTPAVWVWKRISHERGFFAPYRSRSSRAQIRRAARNFAISSKKSMCALKKNESRGAKSSTSRPALDRRVDVGEAVRQRERELLRRRRARLADVVAGDRDRVPSAAAPASSTRSCPTTSRIDGSGG